MLDMLGALAQPVGHGFVIGLHMVSLHSEPTYPCDVQVDGRCNFNNTNPGLYVVAPSGLTLGAYINSYRQWSSYAGWTWHTADNRFALTVGGVTGYRFATVMPVVIPSVRFDLNEQWGARLSVIPKAGDGLVQAVHLSLETRW